ncbi:peptidylprolyl isomerase [Flammeovirgaceae bacterium SG7u.111]|nr:peptidylprolyl isomerase [Flammeovirgaceae bacterium SG7u.132]WPO37416.1 peptidylprolyl isomerase [Flammeovirgaceae bacterium SG7u.111]
MKFTSKKSLAITVGLSLFLGFSAFAQGEGVFVDGIVAKVDNHIVLKSDVENTYYQLLSNGEELGPDPKCEILRQVIVNKILLAKAEIDSIVVDESQVNVELDRRMQYFIMQAGGEDKLEQTLGKKLTVLREELRDQVSEQLTTQRMRGTLTADINVTPAEVKKYFNQIPKDSIPFLPAEVKVGQIVKFPEVSKSEKDKAEQKLYGLKARIEAGEDFAELAMKNSEDFGSAREGGDLGWHGRGELVPEFEATALRLEINEISDPVESEFGFHMIQLLERRGQRFRARHILIRPKSNDFDVTEAMQLMDSIRNQVLGDSLTFENAAKEFSDDQATRSNAGYFKDQNTGSSFVATDMIDPIIFFTIDTMEVGKVSAPMQYRTEDGKAAVRMIYYDKYIPPHYANLKEDYQKLYAATMNRKRAEAVEEWLEEAKQEVYIEVYDDYGNCNILEEL